MLFTTQETSQEFLTRMDESGDSYMEPVNSETLKEVRYNKLINYYSITKKRKYIYSQQIDFLG